MAELRIEKHGKGWRYVFEGAKKEGKRTRITKGGFTTKGEASRAGAKALSEFNNNGEVFNPSTMSIYDFLAVWMKNYCEISLKESTITNYKKKIKNHIVPALGSLKLSSLNTQLLQSFINDIAKRDYSRNTLSVIKGVLSGSLNYAENQRLIAYNPMHSVKLPSPRNERLHPRSAPHFYIPEDTMAKIFQRFPKGTPSYLPLQIGYRCGMRIGEVFGLTWDCVDFENKTLTINKQVQWNEQTRIWYFSNPKYNSFRTIEIDEELLQMLKDEHIKQMKDKLYYGEHYAEYFINKNREINRDHQGDVVKLVLVREDGSYIPPRTMTHVARVVHYDLKIETYTFHSLRHTHATMLAENGAPLKYIQKRLGHKDVAVTLQIYQHLSDKINSQGLAVLNNTMNTPSGCTKG